MELLGGIEAGGTKFVCTVAETPTSVLVERVSFPTTTPQETLAKTIQFFQRFQVKALGVASFGPVDLTLSSPTYGYIMATPKPGWAKTDLLGPLRGEFNVTIGFDTDVNGAALGEYANNLAEHIDSLVYFTVGTGIGGGVVLDGQPVHGLSHPEVGHIPVKRHPQDTYEGSCPFHGDCLEGLACGPALLGRWGVRAETLPPDHLAWELEAHYLAQAVAAVSYVVSPKRVILGGGVMHQPGLLHSIRTKTHRLINGYIADLASPESIDALIIAPTLGDDSGIRGALQLAYRALSA